LIILLNGCTSSSIAKPPLSIFQFEEAFRKDCQNIEVIYEGHDRSGYYFENYSGGNFTNETVGLKEMVVWLSECGANLNEISQILE